MSQKYGQEKDLKIFYYLPNSNYCAIIANDKEEIRDIRRKVLEHYVGEDAGNYKGASPIPKSKKDTSMWAQLIHLQKDISSKIDEDVVDGVSVKMSPVNFDDPKDKKSGLIRLMNLNS